MGPVPLDGLGVPTCKKPMWKFTLPREGTSSQHSGTKQAAEKHLAALAR